MAHWDRGVSIQILLRNAARLKIVESAFNKRCVSHLGLLPADPVLCIIISTLQGLFINQGSVVVDGHSSGWL